MRSRTANSRLCRRLGVPPSGILARAVRRGRANARLRRGMTLFLTPQAARPGVVGTWPLRRDTRISRRRNELVRGGRVRTMGRQVAANDRSRNRVADHRTSASVVPASNFGGKGPSPLERQVAPTVPAPPKWRATSRSGAGTRAARSATSWAARGTSRSTCSPPPTPCLRSRVRRTTGSMHQVRSARRHHGRACGGCRPPDPRSESAKPVSDPVFEAWRSLYRSTTATSTPGWTRPTTRRANGVSKG